MPRITGGGSRFRVRTIRAKSGVPIKGCLIHRGGVVLLPLAQVKTAGGSALRAVQAGVWRLAQSLMPLINARWIQRLRSHGMHNWQGAGVARGAGAPHKIFVDLSVIARNDSRTGIQRVVRSVMNEMRAASADQMLQPLRYDGGKFRTMGWPNATSAVGVPPHPEPGDVFLGLDLSIDAIRKGRKDLLRWKKAGVIFWFVIYDLLPIQHPAYFSAKLSVRFNWWFQTILHLADGFVCISPHVAAELRRILLDRCADGSEIPVAVAPMGVDIAKDSRCGSGSRFSIPEFGQSKFVLAVGTLEPRKGYGDLLDAFELLWSEANDTHLVIVGAPGWKTHALQDRMAKHPEHQRRLHWLTDLGDVALLALYDRAELLVAPSYAEGFGLPIIEAIARSCPVLARDIGAFRAHATLGLRFFPANANALALCRALDSALTEMPKARRDSVPPPLPKWSDTASTILEVIELGSRRMPIG